MALDIENIKALISNEMFEEVTRKKITKKGGISIQEDGIWYGEVNSNDDYKISLNDFAFECKEWAIKIKRYAIMTSENMGGVSVKLFSPSSLIKEFPQIDSQEYIFNYCKWIYEYQY